MKQIITYIVSFIAEGIHKVAYANISSASTMIGYQPQPPTVMLSETEESAI